MTKSAGSVLTADAIIPRRARIHYHAASPLAERAVPGGGEQKMRVRGVRLVGACLALGLLFGWAPARAATFGDCAPIGTLENFEASAPPQTRVFAAEEFRTLEGSDYKAIEKSGKTCLQHYALKQGAPHSSDLEIMQNYADGLPGLGFRITNPNRSPDNEIFATMTKGGVEFWAHVWPSNGDGLHILVMQVTPFQPTLAPAVTAADCAPVRGLRDFATGGAPQTRTFAAEEFRVLQGSEYKSIEKSGETCLQHYALKDGVANKTDLEIMKNYALALPQEGWAITNPNRAEDAEIFATQTRDGVESWLHVWPSNGNGAHVLLLQVTPFQPTLAPAVTAADCAPIRGLRDFETGRAPQTRTFAAEEFRVLQGSEYKSIEKSGKTCLQHYALKDGVANKTDLEIMQNYAMALPQEGWTITNPNRADDAEIFATQTRDGVESWVHVWPSNGNGAHVLLLQIEPFHPSLVPLTALDCAPIRGLQDFAADRPPAQKPYDSLEFRTVEDGQAKTITKTGKTCRQDYALKTGIPNKTDLEIMKNYALALPQEGWSITNASRSEDAELFAAQTRDGVESWVRVSPSNGNGVHVALLQIAPFKSSMKAAQTVDEPPPAPSPPPAPPPQQPALTLTLPAPAATAEPVRADQGDFPYLPPVPGSRLIVGKADPAPFYVQPADAKQPELVANGSIMKEYQSPPGIGIGQLLGLYRTAFLQADWTIVSELHGAGVNLSAHYGQNNRNIWATLYLTDTAYSISVADATMAQNQLAADLGSKCHLALTGVLFDFNKSTLKPESDAVLRQVAALMVADPALKLEIQGHTDNVGSDAYNQPLSEARAHAVVTWLTQNNVAPARLTARGYGKTRPIATNATDEGRAQNRRVEIANPGCKL
jgi:outer membrane protein OmpA-like peptidoglycan-associated protein